MRVKPILVSFVVLTFCLSFSAYAHSQKSDLTKRSQADIKRDLTSKPQQIIKLAGVKKGDKVLDLLGGGGYYTELLANTVGAKGQIVLQNNKAYLPYVGKELKARLLNNRLKNVTKLMSEAGDLRLGTNQYDSAFLVLGYHDFFFKDKGWDVAADVVIPQLLKSLKKGGKFLVIDHSAVKGSGISSAKSLHRIDEDFVKQDLVKRGFKLVKSSEILRNTQDPRDIIAFDPKVRRKTDRFVYLFEKL